MYLFEILFMKYKREYKIEKREHRQAIWVISGTFPSWKIYGLAISENCNKKYHIIFYISWKINKFNSLLNSGVFENQLLLEKVNQVF